MDPFERQPDERDEKLIATMVRRDVFAREEEQATRNISVHVLEAMAVPQRRMPWLKWMAIATPAAICAVIALVLFNPDIHFTDPFLPAPAIETAASVTDDIQLDTFADLGVTPEPSADVLIEMEGDQIVRGLAEATRDDNEHITSFTDGDIDALLQDVDVASM